jgi:hypothetical protein
LIRQNSISNHNAEPILRVAALVVAIRRLYKVILQRDIWMWLPG